MILPNDLQKHKNEETILIPFVMGKIVSNTSDYDRISVGDRLPEKDMFRHFADDFYDCGNDENIRHCIQSAHNRICESLDIEPSAIEFYLSDADGESSFGEYIAEDNVLRINTCYLGYLADHGMSVGANVYNELVQITLQKAKDDLIVNYLNDKYKDDKVHTSVSNYLIASQCNEVIRTKNHIAVTPNNANVANIYTYCQSLELLDKVGNQKLREQLQPIIEKHLHEVKNINSQDLVTLAMKDYNSVMSEFGYCFDGALSHKMITTHKSTNINELANCLLTDIEEAKKLSTNRKPENSR